LFALLYIIQRAISRKEIAMILSLDFSCDIPIYMQIRNQIVSGISDGSLKPGERLTTIRSLEIEIGINTMTVNKSYQLLKQEGYITADRRSGATVNNVFNSSKVLPQKTLDSLKMVISEARLNGISEEEFFNIGREIYKDMGEDLGKDRKADTGKDRKADTEKDGKTVVKKDRETEGGKSI